MFNLRSVFKQDGSMHAEQEMCNMRFDLTDGSVTYKLSQFSNMQTVIRPDGSVNTEQMIGNTRFNLDTGEIDQLF